MSIFYFFIFLYSFKGKAVVVGKDASSIDRTNLEVFL